MRYRRVTDEAELIVALSEPNAVILAGGTDLLVRMRGGQVRPDLLVDVGAVSTLKGIGRIRTASVWIRAERGGIRDPESPE